MKESAVDAQIHVVASGNIFPDINFIRTVEVWQWSILERMRDF
jgi:hypothetical protein